MFKCVKTSLGGLNVPPTVYKELTANESATFGEAMTLSVGKLTKASTNVKYIALKSVDSGEIPVMEVSSHDVYECILTSDPTDMAIGDKVALSTDGMNVAAKSATGVAEIVNFPEGKTTNNKVHVKFN